MVDAHAPDKEVPCKLPETLFDVAQEEEAPEDPRNQIVEDVLPLRMALPAGGDKGAPPPADK
ncbi:UNVERIFIED_CONTAM: hypothetical protein Slati_3421400 [Sesamum latifolium]|uniref:Uncharacterized protein n=1 Tax=Sesamum latifolium TaxID=2727402 RepID=A0AAW2UG97_9LAMI